MATDIEREPLRLERIHRDLLAPRIEAFLAAARGVEAREPYLALREAVETLNVPQALLDRLGAIVEVLIASAQVRAAHGPGAELALWSLYQKTPRGQTIANSVAAMNAALKRLEGQPLQFLNVVARAPGAYALTLGSAECQMILRFEAAGVRIESVEVGNG